MRWVEEGREGLEQLLNQRVNQPAARPGTQASPRQTSPRYFWIIDIWATKNMQKLFLYQKDIWSVIILCAECQIYILTVISQLSAVMQWSFESALIQCFSGVKVYTNYVSIVIKLRFWYSRDSVSEISFQDNSISPQTSLWVASSKRNYEEQMWIWRNTLLHTL